MRDHFIVGLTGPSGAGKSTVSNVFLQSGYTVISADSVAREIIQPKGICIKQLAAAFGEDIITSGGELDRRELARRAFSSEENTKLLNDITHPHIFLRVLTLIRESICAGKPKILFDAPVLFESNSDIMCDAVITVTAPKEIRIKRLIERDGLPREDIECRLSAQHTDEFYTSRSDIVIDGGQELAEVENEVRFVISKLRIEN